MIEQLQQWDASLLLAINATYTDWTDAAFWLLSDKISWLVPILALLYTLRDKPWRTIVTLLVAIGLTVLIADQVASGIIKHSVMRLRPTHDPSLSGIVHIVNGYRGGLYGFVSSHAANTVGITIVLCIAMASRPLTIVMGVWTALVCYSRMYLGVHYPGDIIGGAAVGAVAALLVIAIYRVVNKRFPQWALPHFTDRDSRLMIIAYLVNATAVIVWATITM